jgi:hypothetical protein
MWGLRAEQVIGRELFALPLGEVIEHTRAAFERMLESGQTQDADGVPYAVAGGAPRRATVRIAPIKDGTGEIVAAVATARPQ